MGYGRSRGRRTSTSMWQRRQIWYAGGQVEVHSEKHCIRTIWAGQAMLKINAAHTYI